MENPHDVVPYFENDGGFIRRVTKRDAYKQGYDSRDAEVEVLTAEKLQCRSVVDDLTKSLREQDAMNTEKDARIVELEKILLVLLGWYKSDSLNVEGKLESYQKRIVKTVERILAKHT